MAADYSWIPAYEAAASGAYGDQSMAVLQRLLAENHPNAPDLLASGAITGPSSQATPGFYESGNNGVAQTGAGVDWSKLPQMGPGVDTPANSMWAQVDSPYRVDPYTMKPVGAKPGAPTYQDENYGLLSLIQKRAPDDMTMKLGRALVLSLVGGGVAGLAAPAIGGALGFGSGANPFIAALLKTIPGLAQGQNPFSSLGSAVGGATGIPFGSTLGSFAGSQIGRGG